MSFAVPFERTTGAVVIGLGVLLLAGCSLLSDTDQTRIVWGRSIDGVEIGDSRTDVKKKLGPPDETLPTDLAGEFYLYHAGQEDDRTEVKVAISDDPAVGIGVVGIRVFAPYAGKTKGGVGIGTPRGEVLERLGPPDRRARRWDTYEYERRESVIEYREGVVYSLSVEACPGCQGDTESGT